MIPLLIFEKDLVFKVIDSVVTSNDVTFIFESPIAQQQKE